MTRQRLGVCYYPEHWPQSRWSEDAAMMKEIGLSFVRIGEFAWSRLEPSDGAYRFEWLSRAIEALDRAGLKVVLGTPTATPPKWLVDKMPEMAALDADGRPRKFGSRRHYCFSHEGYAQECERIVEHLARAFGGHPAVAAWQTDNEYGCHDTVLSYSPAALQAFRRWCEAKYRSIETLNEAWGNVFWSMEYRSFDAIELPNLTVTEANPSHLMDFQRFSSDQVVAFNRRQAQIIRRHAPDATILHNFMGAFVDFDHYALSDDLDIAAWDSYPLGFLERSSHDDDFKLRYMRVGDPDFQAFHHDLYRACGRGRWQVMEQQPGPVNWAPWNPAPAKGAVRLWTFEAFAAGAEAVSYFRWRQAPFAQEQMHEGLLLPNAAPNEAYDVVAHISKELDALNAHVETARAPVALIFDYESAWAWRIEPQGQNFSYFDLVLGFYRALRRAGLSIDVIPPTAAAIADRRLIIASALFAPSDDFAEALAKSDATILLGPRAGSKTADFQIPAELPPGVLRGVIDIRVRRVESLRPGARITLSGQGAFVRWREFLALGESVAPEFTSEDGETALARSDNVFYLAGWPDEELLKSVLRRVFVVAGISTLDLPEDIRVRDNGAMRYIFNYGATTTDISALVGEETLLIGSCLLEPCGVAVFRRRD
ncbi:beta-galactosidase [Methylocystis sp. FS]|uniref:beta-galactosidase n=1 Tax=Methylocystis silviterrae TaxID=2743612 RepID=UPI0015826E9F|nr:beta-galactosidase [Methylocystis silviterrae]NUJ81614.1 beta-galactosidase [Methylocystis silviterrae]